MADGRPGKEISSIPAKLKKKGIHMQYQAINWEDIEADQQLPPFTYELSLLRMVAFVRATGLYDYVHFDRDYAQAAGARDVFIATPHVAGLLGRLLTDWAGPGADIRSLTFSMQKQSCSNDILTVSGKVGRKYRSDQGEYLVDLTDLNIGHGVAPQTLVASATMALPSKVGGPVTGGHRVEQQRTSELDPSMPDFAKALIGKVRDGQAEPARPLTADEIHLWCEALEDWNPLYWDEEYARKSRYGGIIAPPTGMFYGAGSSTTLGIGYGKPGTKVPDAVKKGLTGLSLLQSLRTDMLAAVSPIMLPDYPEVAVVVARADYFTPLRPGDSAHSRIKLLNCSPKKRTKLGEGYFVTFLHALYNQKEELIKNFTLTLLLYHV
jgi:acyl dehydratase